MHDNKCKQTLVGNMLTSENPEEQRLEQEIVSDDEYEQTTEEDEKCMRISSQAMESDTVKTLSVIIRIGGKRAVALLDSGSNSTFMSLSFALKLLHNSEG